MAKGWAPCGGEQKARQKLAEAGFANVEVKQISCDPLNFHYIARKSGA